MLGRFDTMRNILRRFRWTPEYTSDKRETYFPPDGLPLSGITLDCRHGGFWERVDPKDDSEIVETDPDKLVKYLEGVQPYIE